MYSLFFKQFLDFFVSFILIILILPLLGIITLLLLIFNEGAGAFFLQERPGYKGRIFKVIKFKTMNERRGDDGRLLPDVQRITKFGNFIRKSSLDELPQLFNVFIGDMSIIGPRPLLTKYLPLYSNDQARRHDVRPGITGWAQCHGRNALSWKEKLKLDVWYVDNISFKTDLLILGVTIKKVLCRESINTNVKKAKFTMDEFNGNN